MYEGIPIVTDPLREDWIVIAIFTSLLLLAVVITFKRSLLVSVVSFYSPLHSGRDREDERQMLAWQNILANIYSYINIALFIYLLIHLSPYNQIIIGLHGWRLWLLILAAIAAIVMLRHIACILTGWLSETMAAYKEYMALIYMQYNSTALILLPLNISICFIPDTPDTLLLYAGVGTILITYIVRLTRLYAIFIRNHISLLYYILYLCALELLPAAIFYRIIIPQ